jgi:hypothetical protein
VSASYPAIQLEPSQILRSRENVAAAVCDLEVVRFPSKEAGGCHLMKDVETNAVAEKRAPFRDPNTLECLGAQAGP